MHIGHKILFVFLGSLVAIVPIILTIKDIILLIKG